MKIEWTSVANTTGLVGIAGSRPLLTGARYIFNNPASVNVRTTIAVVYFLTPLVKISGSALDNLHCSLNHFYGLALINFSNDEVDNYTTDHIPSKIRSFIRLHLSSCFGFFSAFLTECTCSPTGDHF